MVPYQPIPLLRTRGRLVGERHGEHQRSSNTKLHYLSSAVMCHLNRERIKWLDSLLTLDTRPQGDDSLHNIEFMENVERIYYIKQDYRILYTKLPPCFYMKLKCSADNWLAVPVQIINLNSLPGNKTKPSTGYCQCPNFKCCKECFPQFTSTAIHQITLGKCSRKAKRIANQHAHNN